MSEKERECSKKEKMKSSESEEDHANVSNARISEATENGSSNKDVVGGNEKRTPSVSPKAVVWKSDLISGPEKSKAKSPDKSGVPPGILKTSGISPDKRANYTIVKREFTPPRKLSTSPQNINSNDPISIKGGQKSPVVKVKPPSIRGGSKSPSTNEKPLVAAASTKQSPMSKFKSSKIKQIISPKKWFVKECEGKEPVSRKKSNTDVECIKSVKGSPKSRTSMSSTFRKSKSAIPGNDPSSVVYYTNLHFSKLKLKDSSLTTIYNLQNSMYRSLDSLFTSEKRSPCRDESDEQSLGNSFISENKREEKHKITNMSSDKLGYAYLLNHPQRDCEITVLCRQMEFLHVLDYSLQRLCNFTEKNISNLKMASGNRDLSTFINSAVVSYKNLLLYKDKDNDRFLHMDLLPFVKLGFKYKPAFSEKRVNLHDRTILYAEGCFSCSLICVVFAEHCLANCRLAACIELGYLALLFITKFLKLTGIRGTYDVIYYLIKQNIVTALLYSHIYKEDFSTDTENPTLIVDVFYEDLTWALHSDCPEKLKDIKVPTSFNNFVKSFYSMQPSFFNDKQMEYEQICLIVIDAGSRIVNTCKELRRTNLLSDEYVKIFIDNNKALDCISQKVFSFDSKHFGSCLAKLKAMSCSLQTDCLSYDGRNKMYKLIDENFCKASCLEEMQRPNMDVSYSADLSREWNLFRIWSYVDLIWEYQSLVRAEFIFEDLGRIRDEAYEDTPSSCRGNIIKSLAALVQLDYYCGMISIKKISYLEKEMKLSLKTIFEEINSELVMREFLELILQRVNGIYNSTEEHKSDSLCVGLKLLKIIFLALPVLAAFFSDDKLLDDLVADSIEELENILIVRALEGPTLIAPGEHITAFSQKELYGIMGNNEPMYNTESEDPPEDMNTSFLKSTRPYKIPNLVDHSYVKYAIGSAAASVKPTLNKYYSPVGRHCQSKYNAIDLSSFRERLENIVRDEALYEIRSNDFENERMCDIIEIINYKQFDKGEDRTLQLYQLVQFMEMVTENIEIGLRSRQSKLKQPEETDDGEKDLAIWSDEIWICRFGDIQQLITNFIYSDERNYKQLLQLLYKISLYMGYPRDLYMAKPSVVKMFS